MSSGSSSDSFSDPEVSVEVERIIQEVVWRVETRVWDAVRLDTIFPFDPKVDPPLDPSFGLFEMDGKQLTPKARGNSPEETRGKKEKCPCKFLHYFKREARLLCQIRQRI